MGPSIKVAEAAKVIENAQRDINIAFVNELARIFNLSGIDTREVLEAASTKWNFMRFEPGIVGGHCIAINPYYLIHKALELDYVPEILHAGRRMNDTMPNFVAFQVVKIMNQKGITIIASKVLVLGITFKEHCPDLRNSKVIDVIHELEDSGCQVYVIDPWASPKHVYHEFGVHLKSNEHSPTRHGRIAIDDYDAVVIAVAHREFLNYDFSAMKASNKVIYDCKGMLPKDDVDARL